MKAILTFLLALFACVAEAAYVTIDVTFTNRTYIGSNFVINGATVIWTNAPLNNSTWITTNSAAGSATNLNRFIGARYPGLAHSMTNATNVTISGFDLQFSINGGYAVLSTNSGTPTNRYALMVPFDRDPYATNRTNNADELIYGINKYALTNAFDQTAQALTNFVSRTNAQAVSHKVLSLSHFTGGAVSNSTLNNITSGNIGSLTVTSATIHSITATNAFLTNSRAILTTNLQVVGSFFGTNGIVHTLTVTNLSAPGSGSSSLQIGSGANAGGTSAVSLGDNSVATNDFSISLGYGTISSGNASLAIGYSTLASNGVSPAIAIGPGALALGENSIAFGGDATVTAEHTNSVAIGFEATTTGTNQIRLGTATHHVSVAGEIRGVVLTNEVHRGTNVFNSRVDFTSRANSGLVNGYNSGIVLGSNVYVRLSGPSGAYTNAGFVAEQDGSFHILQFDNPVNNMTLLDASGLDAAAANRIILSGASGGLLNFTNNPVIIPVIYDGSASRWRILTGMLYR